MRVTISRLNAFAIVLTAAFLVFILTNGIPGGYIFANLLWADMPSALLMLVILLVGYWYGEQKAGGQGWVEQLLLALDRNRMIVAVALWVALCAGSLWVYQNHPLSMDEYSAVFQARVFAAGGSHGQFPPDLLDNLVPAIFQNVFLVVNHETGAVASLYWPGFSLLLAPFVWLDIPWACNPTIVAASILLIGRVARDVADSPHAAGWAMLFALASPAFVANGITYYSMPAHLLFNLGFAWLLLVLSPMRLFLAGLIGGFAMALHNPFPHIAFALPWVIWLAARRGQGLRNLAILAAGYLPMVLLLVLGWPFWKQHVLLAGSNVPAVAQAASVATVSLADRLYGMLHRFLAPFSLPNGSIVMDRTGGLAKLWLWASPMLLLLAWWGARGEKSPGLRLMAISAVLTFLAYFFVPFDQGHGWGYRYFHSAWGVLPVLAALGVIKLSAEGPWVFRQVALLALVSLVAANGIRFVEMGTFMKAYLAQFPPRVEAERRIVLHNGKGYYARDMIQNDPWLRGKEIILLVKTEEDKQKILEHFPNAREAASNDYGTTLVESSVKP